MIYYDKTKIIDYFLLFNSLIEVIIIFTTDLMRCPAWEQVTVGICTLYNVLCTMYNNVLVTMY